MRRWFVLEHGQGLFKSANFINGGWVLHVVGYLNFSRETVLYQRTQYLIGNTIVGWAIVLRIIFEHFVKMFYFINVSPNFHSKIRFTISADLTCFWLCLLRGSRGLTGSRRCILHPIEVKLNFGQSRSYH